MLQILNKTPFQASLTLFTDKMGAEKVAIAVKGTFNIPNNCNEAQLAEEQLPVLFADEYYGEPGQSSIKYPVDLVLEKLNTDIGFVGNAHRPDNKPVTQLPVSLRVGRLQKTIMVVGDRFWKKRSMMPGYDISDPIPFKEMPIIYERAFGGIDQTHQDEKKQGGYSQNPIGAGFLLNGDNVENKPLPNLEDPDHLIKNWKDKPPLACYGFIDGAWEQRLKFVGTYNDDWQKNQFPLLPEDFDSRFFNAAHPAFIADGYLNGGEIVQMVNLSKKGILEFLLPKYELDLMFRLGETRNFHKANLWTVVFEPDEDRFYMVWGGSFNIGKQPTKMKYVKVEIHGDSN